MKSFLLVTKNKVGWNERDLGEYWGVWNLMEVFLGRSGGGGWYWKVESGEKIQREYKVQGFVSCQKAHRDFLNFAEKMNWMLPMEFLEDPSE